MKCIKKWLVGSATVISMILLSCSTHAQLVGGPWSWGLGGGGFVHLGGDYDKNALADGELDASKLYNYGSISFESGIRQGLICSEESDNQITSINERCKREIVSVNDGNHYYWTFSTKAFTDVKLFRYKIVEADAGVNAGPEYGDSPVVWEASPEIVGRLYLSKTVDLFSRVEAPFRLNDNAAFENKMPITAGFRISF
jgi:hypothetical protein